MTNVLKCVPPEDKPKINELTNCSNCFNSEIENLKALKVIVYLGKLLLIIVLRFIKKSLIQ